MGEPLNVTHVVLALETGGLERVVVNLAREGARLGDRVSVLCLEQPGGLAKELENSGVSVECVHKAPGIRFGTTQAIVRRLRGLRPNVVHTHVIGALFYAGPAARWVGVPAVVHTEHGKY